VCEQGDPRAVPVSLHMLILGQFNTKASIRQTLVNKPILAAYL